MNNNQSLDAFSTMSVPRAVIKNAESSAPVKT